LIGCWGDDLVWANVLAGVKIACIVIDCWSGAVYGHPERWLLYWSSFHRHSDYQLLRRSLRWNKIWPLRWNRSPFLCWYDHMSMSWANLDFLKGFAPTVEVDKHHSFPIHLHSPWSTSKCSLRLRILHF
jgi:hypothetical protein